MKGKKSNVVKIVMIIVLLVAVGLGIYYFAFSGSEGERTILKNPVEGLSDEEAIEIFDEGFVVYLLYAIGADELHNIPLTFKEPKIKFYIDDEVYTAIVRKGAIEVGEGVSDDEDIIIMTSKSEAVKMVRDRNYVTESFANGGSGIDLVAGKATLFAKGYFGLYSSLTGEELEDE